LKLIVIVGKKHETGPTTIGVGWRGSDSIEKTKEKTGIRGENKGKKKEPSHKGRRGDSWEI